MKKKPLNNILVKPAGPDCNMVCQYCFYSDKSGLFPGDTKHRMNEAVLDEMIKQLFQKGNRQISISWQGGEPSLMGISFFERAVELMQQHGESQEVGNGFQTNGLLMDRAWAKFFRKYKFLVGLSIDGPEHIHDKYRMRRGGSGSFAKVLDTAKMFLNEDVSVNSLSVVNKYSAGYPEETYCFLKKTGFKYMQFIPCVEADKNQPGKKAPFSVSPETYGKFLCRIFDLWRSDIENGYSKTSVRFFDSLLFKYAGFDPPECTLLPECGNYIVVEHNGDVFSCDFFVEKKWRLGNLMEQDLESMLNSEKQLEFGRMKGSLSEQCELCEWLKYCNGGCTRERMMPCADGTSYLCEAYKIFFRHADKKLHQIIKGWQKKQIKEELLPGLKSGKTGRNEPCTCGSGLKYKKCCGK